MKYIFLVLVSLSMMSCTVYGFSNDYQKLDASQKSRILPFQNDADTDSVHIFKLNASQLKTEMAKYPKSLVYVFKNGCTSSYCKPMSVYERFAKEHHYKLFLVMDGYGQLYETTKQRSAAFTAPLFAIDNDHYGSNVRMKYTRYFINELKGNDLKTKNDWDDSLFYFENGTLIKSSLILEE